MKFKKRKKSTRMHGHGMGTHGTGARKKKRGSGQRGGKGLSGSGKRADHKGTLIAKIYGNKYFGKQGITSRGTKRDKRKRINLEDVEKNLEKYGKKEKDIWKVDLKDYKILAGEKNYFPKNKIIIKAKEASKSAIEKIEKVGGKIEVNSKSKKEKSQIVKTDKENLSK